MSYPKVSYPTVTIAHGRDKALRRRHPWVFSGAVAASEDFSPGDIVDLRTKDGTFLGRGYGNKKSQIFVRVLTWDEGEAIDQEFWHRRISQAVARRQALLTTTTASRLVMGEADMLPGLIVDRYGGWLVVQALTAGIDHHLDVILEVLRRVSPCEGVVERSDDAVRRLEGLDTTARILAGKPPPEEGIAITEAGLTFSVDASLGHKTGYYLDQRRNRQIVASHARDKKVLDCFSYTGGFSVHAAAARAKSVLSIDQSAPALSRTATHLAANGFTDRERYRQIHGDAFSVLRDLVTQGDTFDLIVLDPPKFAATAGQVERAARGYKDINLQAFRLLKPGGILATFSCSGHISADLFQKIVFGAALDGGRQAQIIQTLTQDEDHPILLSVPETWYLKGLLCRVIEA